MVVAGGGGGRGGGAPDTALALDGSECVRRSRGGSEGRTPLIIYQSQRERNFVTKLVSDFLIMSGAQPLVFHLMGRLRSLGVKY